MPEQSHSQHRVIVFTTPSCTYCNRTKKYFHDKGVKFKEVDVSRDAAASRDMVKRSRQMGVPVVDIGGKLGSGLTGQRSINI